MSTKHINDVESFNLGLQAALDVLKQHFFAGNLDGGNHAIIQIEKMIVPITENGVYNEVYIPNFVAEEQIEPVDLLDLA